MKNGEVYYGKPYNPTLLSILSYPNALRQKIKWAKALIIKLDKMPISIEVDGVVHPIRDMRRRNRAAKAIRDNEKLLVELRQ